MPCFSPFLAICALLVATAQAQPSIDPPLSDTVSCIDTQNKMDCLFAVLNNNNCNSNRGPFSGDCPHTTELCADKVCSGEIQCEDADGITCAFQNPIPDPAPIDEPRMCCMAMTASCLACSRNISEEEYCSEYPDTAGCPVIDPPEEPRLCCKAMIASCLACFEGVSQKHFCHHHPTTLGCNKADFHDKRSLWMIQIIQWAIGLLIAAAGLIWGYCERKRRRTLTDRPERLGAYTAGLFECLTKPRMWFPACLFTPVLAAFNRAEVDERECSVCDVCFALIKPVAQYTTRQSIRGKYELAPQECTDLLSACCCTPCAVAQDTMELENRASQDNNHPEQFPGQHTAPGASVFVMPTAQAVAYAQVSEKETSTETEMKRDCVHAENQV